MLRRLLELTVDDHLPVARECDDVHLLKRVAMSGDTVLASTDAAVADEVDAGRLVMLQMRGVPPLYSDVGIVSLKGRSFSPMAEFAVTYLREIATDKK